MMLIVLLCTLHFSVVQASASENYVALGDSLAAGQTPQQAIDTGYSDLIAQALQQSGNLSFYTKRLAFPGFTTSDVVKRVQEEGSQELLRNASLITISAGANDLLPLVQSNANAGTLQFNQQAADFALNRARKQMQTLLTEVKARAPQAKIYVMGYYFAFPFVHDSQKIGTGTQLEMLNAILQQEAENAGATFIDVYDDFGLKAVNYVPNANDVHPNINGYRIMANAFLRHYGGGAMQISEAQMPAPNPLTFEEIIATQKETGASQATDEKKTVAKIDVLAPIKEYFAMF